MENNGREIRFGDIFYLFLKEWRIMVSLALAGLIAGMIFSGVGYVRSEVKKKYKITSSVAVVAQNRDGTFTTQTVEPIQDDITVAEQITNSAMYIIGSKRTIDAAIDKSKIVGLSAKEIRKNLTAIKHDNTQLIEITLFWHSASEGISILNAINKVSDSILLDTLKVGRVSVVDYPEAIKVSQGGINISVWLFAMLAGLALGVAWCLLKFLINPTVINKQDISNTLGLELLGCVEEDDKFARLRPLSEEMMPARDEIVSICHILANRMERAGAGKIYVTSAAHEEGTSRLVAEIAVQFAKMGKKTLLIDCNFDKPSLGGLFKDKLEYENSFNALYCGDADKYDAVIQVAGGLDLLPVILEDNPPRLNGAMLDMLKNLTDGYDYVFIDTAPIGTDTEVIELNRITDAVLFNTAFDRTYLDEAKTAVGQIRDSGIPIIGCVMNFERNWRNAIKVKRLDINRIFKRKKPRNNKKLPQDGKNTDL